jgi:hypothetical protein
VPKVERRKRQPGGERMNAWAGDGGARKAESGERESSRAPGQSNDARRVTRSRACITASASGPTVVLGDGQTEEVLARASRPKRFRAD